MARPVPSLPRPLTTFVGRTIEIEHIRAQLFAHHLVTLVGSAGVGKTRLALEVASREPDRFGRGVVVCEFSGALPSQVGPPWARRSASSGAPCTVPRRASSSGCTTRSCCSSSTTVRTPWSRWENWRRRSRGSLRHVACWPRREAHHLLEHARSSNVFERHVVTRSDGFRSFTRTDELEEALGRDTVHRRHTERALGINGDRRQHSGR